MNLEELLGKMEDFKNAKLEMIDKTYDNIRKEASEGNSEARTILNHGNVAEIKDMINVALNK